MTTIKQITEAVIYNMENGEENIYIKENGREVLGDYKLDSLRIKMAHAQLWHQIHLAAKTNPVLKRALDEAELIYKLSK
jgi:hypothetical protein